MSTNQPALDFLWERRGGIAFRLWGGRELDWRERDQVGWWYSVYVDADALLETDVGEPESSAGTEYDIRHASY